MAVTYGFFNSVNGDRKYNAEQMSEYFRGIINEGVYQHLDGGLAVTAGTGLAVSVASGRAIIQNRWVQNSAALSLTIAAASETYARKDAVVIRLNWSSRSISIAVKTGTPAASPVAPSMTRNSTTYEMALAYVNVAANVTSVTVTDKRSDSTVCGWVTVAQSTSGEVDAQLNALKTGFDGVEYPSPAEQVIGSDTKLQNEILTLGLQTTISYLSNTDMDASSLGTSSGSMVAVIDIRNLHGAVCELKPINKNRFRVAYAKEVYTSVASGTSIYEFQNYDSYTEKQITISDRNIYQTLVVYLKYNNVALDSSLNARSYYQQSDVILKSSDITNELSYTYGYVDKNYVEVVDSDAYVISENIMLPAGASIKLISFANAVVSSITKTDKDGTLLSVLVAGQSAMATATYTNETNQTEYVKVCFSESRDHSVIITYSSLYGAFSSAKNSKIVIKKTGDSSFSVYSYDDNGKFLEHTFVKDHAEKEIDGTTYVTMDVWYADHIKNESNNIIMQGNANFIHNIVDHTGFVGAGDGCCVALWSLFFIDGKEFDPTTLTTPLYGSEFRFTEKVKHYLSDGTKTTGTIPVIVDGSPVIESFNFIDYVLKGNNEIEHRNKLVMNMDNIQFSECHGAMVACYPPYFTDVIINNKEMSWNGVDLEDNFAIIKKGGTSLNLKTNGYVRANEVIMFGEKYRVTNQLFQMDGDRNKVTNIRPWFPPNVDNRIKFYMMPVVCTSSAENIAEGETVETFNTGDEINVIVKRKIDISE